MWFFIVGVILVFLAVTAAIAARGLNFLGITFLVIGLVICLLFWPFAWPGSWFAGWGQQSGAAAVQGGNNYSAYDISDEDFNNLNTALNELGHVNLSEIEIKQLGAAINEGKFLDVKFSPVEQDKVYCGLHDGNIAFRLYINGKGQIAGAAYAEESFINNLLDKVDEVQARP